jgi:spore maturation protein CgeB
MGHQVFESSIDWLSAFAPDLYPSLTRQVRSEILVSEVREAHKKHRIDLFLSHFFNQHVYPDAIKIITEMGMPTVNFCSDNVRSPEVVSEIRSAFSLNWVPELEATFEYKSKQIPFIYLPMAANPELYKPMTPVKEYDVVFVGGADPERHSLIAALLRAQVPVTVFGNGWDVGVPKNGVGVDQSSSCNNLSTNHSQEPQPQLSPTFARGVSLMVNQYKTVRKFGPRGLYRKFQNMYLVRKNGPLTVKAWEGPVTDEEMVRLYSEAKVSLGINRVFEINFPRLRFKYAKLRDFEAPMSGACYLTEHCPDLEESYEIGKEIWTYRSEDELIEKSRELLTHESLRSELKIAARRGSLQRHTWNHRFQSLFAELSLVDDYL